MSDALPHTSEQYITYGNTKELYNYSKTGYIHEATEEENWQAPNSAPILFINTDVEIML